MITNAQLTDILSLTDALLDAGHCRGTEAQGFTTDDGTRIYPTQHCLIGALKVAIREVDPPRGVGREVLERVARHLAHFLPANGASQLLGQLVMFNDGCLISNRPPAGRVGLRALLVRAAAELVK